MLNEDDIRTTLACLYYLHDQKICSDWDDYRSIMSKLNAVLLVCSTGEQTEAIKALEEYAERKEE